MSFRSLKRSTIAVLATWLWALAGPSFIYAQTTTMEQVRELHAKSAQVQVTVTSGRILRGRIVQVANDTFVVRHKDGAEETVEFAHVTKISKQGIRKSVWLPAVIGGAVLVALCVGPYPIGFLCRSDPS